jgi:hypothetical protein
MAIKRNQTQTIFTFCGQATALNLMVPEQVDVMPRLDECMLGSK